MQTLEWIGDAGGFLRLLDQTRLPGEIVAVDCRDVETLFEAIRSLRVRGAPAIGVSAAYGVCLGLQSCAAADAAAAQAAVDRTAARLAESRPTAVNLFWALERMQRRARALADLPRDALLEKLLAEARAIHDEDRRMCHEIGRHGAALLPDGAGVLTHCNAGGLATSEYGTALGVICAAHDAGKRLHVWVDETRPLLQGARLTAWELSQHGVPATLICDSMAAWVMREGRVQAVVVGADRIAANGDTANKIGTYGVALAARAHNIPFYVAAPSSTFDLALADGSAITIEQRAAAEITHGFGRATAPAGMATYNPAFDVTPAELIGAIVCERGVISPVNRASIAQMLSGD
ncbi:MAG: S-methyl-5-thioribose-1-phosphate isomerase [Planctomycetes bacterium]|nr:S-methyl-5-thioribose-1-phosphate isomerase [Planctomycetota bacterium]